MGQNMRCTRIHGAQGWEGERPYGCRQSGWGNGQGISQGISQRGIARQRADVST